MNFYKNLPTIDRKMQDVLKNEGFFIQFPVDWHIVVADIANSTQAVEAGRHDDVNLIAAGSLIAVLNVSKTFDTEIPYFFGGDGGTVIIPGELLEKVLAALHAHRRNSLKSFSLDLKIGSISIQEVINAGYDIKVAKVLITKGFTKSIVIGDGLKHAEAVIKKSMHTGVDEKLSTEQENVNMEGLECRWDRIKPPATQVEVVCLLVETIKPEDQLPVYRDVLMKLDEIYGEVDKRHPLTMKALKLLNSFKKIKKEMLVRYGRKNVSHFVKAFFETMIGKLFFKYNLKVKELKGQDYLQQLIEYSDILTIDGRINTIVSGTAENRQQLIAYLNEQEIKGLLIYGHHVSPESIMTCYIESRKNKHIHFVDGSNGGYTQAAKELKLKLKELN